jgi:uncharacterized protein YjbJ (UPF0337 family)
MVNQQTLQGNWNELKGKLRSKWGQLTNDELQTFDGNVDRLVGLIQRKTGEARGAIERYLEELTSNGSSTVAQAVETAREYAQQAAGTIQHASQQAAESMQHGYQEAERVVKQRPVESVAVCFGAGVLAGVVLGLMLRSR